MTTSTQTRTPAGVMDQTRALLATVTDPAPSVRYSRDCLAAALDLYDRIESGEADPYEARAEGMAWWDDPQQSALEYLADEAGQLVIALEKRIAEAARDAARTAAANHPIPVGGN